MKAIVTEIATSEPAKTRAELERLGYRERVVWIKEISSLDKTGTEIELRSLGVGQFLVSDYWGRGPE